MKKITLPFSFLAFMLALSSCSLFTRTSLSRATIGDKCYLDVKIFQAMNSHEALASGIESNSIVVKLITAEDTFYDGKRISGSYIMVDTYTYENKLETIKTVPVFIKVNEYNNYKPLQKEEPKGQKL